MHTTVSYKGRNDPDRAAVADCLQYMGSAESYKLLVRGFREAETPKDCHTLNITCAFVVGISGFPFFALIRRYSRAGLFQEYWDSGLLH